MRKRGSVRNVFLRLTLLSFVLACLPLAKTYAVEWSSPKTLLHIISEGSDSEGRIYLVIEEAENPEGCVDQMAPNHYRIYGNTLKGKNHLAVAMLAFAAGYKVSVYLHGCDDASRPVINGFRVLK